MVLLVDTLVGWGMQSHRIDHLYLPKVGLIVLEEMIRKFEHHSPTFPSSR